MHTPTRHTTHKCYKAFFLFRSLCKCMRYHSLSWAELSLGFPLPEQMLSPGVCSFPRSLELIVKITFCLFYFWLWFLDGGHTTLPRDSWTECLSHHPVSRSLVLVLLEVCVCVYVCMCTCMYVCVWVRTRTGVQVCVCLHVCACRCVRMCAGVCDLCVCLSVNRYVCPYGNQSASPQEEIHAWYCKPGQKPMAVGILDPEEMLLLFVLLNAYVTKLPSRYLSLFL